MMKWVLSFVAALNVSIAQAKVSAPVLRDKVRRPANAAPPAASAKMPANLNRESVYQIFKEELEKSLKKTVQTRVSKTVKIDNQLARAEDPWTFNNNIRLSETTTNPRYREYLSTSTLRYQTQRGFSLQTYFDLYDNSAFGVSSSRYSRSNMGISISQDLFSLTSKTVFDYSIEITEMQSRAKLISADENFLSEIIKIIDSSYGFFTALCKRQDLEKIIVLAQNAVSVADVQFSAKTIGTRDYLRIKDTLLSMRRQVRNNDYEIDSYQRQFSTLTPAAEEVARKIAREHVVCESNLDDVGKTTYPPRDEFQALIKKYPSLVTMDISRDVIKKRFESYRRQRLATLNLTAGFDQVNNIGPATPYNQTYVGVVFTYQFKGDQYDLNKQSVQEQLNDLSVNQRQTTMDVTNYLMNFYEDIKFFGQQVEMTRESIENSSKLMRVLETQQSIGQIDANALDSAFQAYTNALADQRELITKISSIALKLSEIRQAIVKIDQAKTDQNSADRNSL